MQPGVKISASQKQKDEIILEGNDIELVSRSGKATLFYLFDYVVRRTWKNRI